MIPAARSPQRPVVPIRRRPPLCPIPPAVFLEPAYDIEEPPGGDREDDYDDAA